MQQSLCSCFFAVDSFPFEGSNFLRPVAAPASRKSILKYSCRMLE